MIYLLRHGLDDEKYVGGWSDVDLLEEGIKQIEGSRDYILKNNLTINEIISSDVKRAISTANIISKALNIKVKTDKNLRELNKGDYTGRNKETLTDSEKKFMENMNIKTRYPNGESMFDLYNRIKIYLKSINRENTLIVTHRGVINMIYYILTNTPLDMDKEKFNVTHGSIHELDIKKGKIRRIY